MTRNILFAIIALVISPILSAQQTVALRWIGEPPAVETGASWGVPFEKGQVKQNQAFTLSAEGADNLPLQNWPLAFWPDGSVKWMGFATAGQPQRGYQLNIVRRAPTQKGISVNQRRNLITVTNDQLTCKINTSGAILIPEITLNNAVIAENGKLIARLEDRSQQHQQLISYEGFESAISKVEVEQSGPIRAVIKIEGVHQSLRTSRQLLPFTVRLYFYHGINQIRLVHSFAFDGDQETDFIKGLGLSFDVPFRESTHNRHVRFSGENDGLWSEPVKPIVTRYQFVYNGERNLPQLQMSGQRVPEILPVDSAPHSWFQHLPEWDSYKMTQLHSDAFTIRKRTNDRSSWLFAAAGGRSSGLAMVGDVSGGLAVSIKNFWQSFPASYEIHGARSEKATLQAWCWSPDADAMDLRHYDTIGHDLLATYEDIQEGLSTPYGIARTSELTLFILDDVPAKEEMAEMASLGAETHQIACTPAYYHRTRAFGRWSLPDRSNTTKAWIENQLDSSLLFYRRAIDEHKWYGFWDYGDVMHTYDASRHMWRYDIGGYAWANTELAPGLWLWYSFLRTGRADVFKMAEAMTRHTGDVDAYHLGDMVGLGTRHNVSHWGCGAKEARVGQAAWKRPHYYLTTDERSGDLMRIALGAEESTVRLDPLRIAQPRERFPFEGPARLRWGPDWTSLVSNWFTEWERTGDRQYLRKIVAGMESLSKLPDNLFTGPGGLSYDPKTGKLTYDGRPGVVNKNHLATLMGGYEVMTEVLDAIDHPAFRKTFIEFARHYNMPADDPARTPKTRNWGNVSFPIPRLTAYAAAEKKDKQLAERAWREFFGNRYQPGSGLPSMYDGKLISPPDVLNPIHENPRVGTNGASQWGLNAIIMLDLIGEFLTDPAEQASILKMDSLLKLPTKTLLHDDFSKGWRNNWMLDGDRATLKTSSRGLSLQAGPTPASDADHTVLWTKESFEGNLRIEFEFTRNDSATKYVNILYLFAEGSGEAPYHKDIAQWNHLRTTPAMRTYFNHMNLYHISFAAFENDNFDPQADYIRARRYMPEMKQGLTGTELLPEYEITGLFQPGVKHKVTVVRYNDDLYMEVSNANKSKRFHWKTDTFPKLESGRIGLRLMGSRASTFHQFRVSKL